MKKLFYLFFLLSITVQANIKEDMFNFYENKKYEKVCNLGFSNFNKFPRDQDFLMLYSFGCLHSDYIDRLTVPIGMLKYTKEARKNAAYFAAILLQKKLLYNALVDGYPLSSYKFPTTDYILSKIFDYYTALGEHNPRNFYLFDDHKNPKLTYKLYLNKTSKPYKMIIEEYYDNTLVKKHIYW